MDNQNNDMEIDYEEVKEAEKKEKEFEVEKYEEEKEEIEENAEIKEAAKKEIKEENNELTETKKETEANKEVKEVNNLTEENENVTEKKEEVSEDNEGNTLGGKKHGRLRKILMFSGIVIAVLVMIFSWLVFTDSGNRLIYKVAGYLIYKGLGKDDVSETQTVIVPLDDNFKEDGNEKTHDMANEENKKNDTENNIIKKEKPEPRSEDYVSNYLIFGVEEIDNARNTDAILIASINTKDNTIKLTSLLRDTYIETENDKPHKLNAFFGLGGANRLVEVIEDNYRIKIDGYAYINFESFEKIVDLLGGITIELSEEEADYLNSTNYISNPIYRNVRPGLNHLNGNQALGYCRIRMVKTLGGAADDYGRTLRHRRVLSAIFEKYKSKGLVDLIIIANKILKYIKTNVTQEQIEKALENIIENKITKMETMRIPVNGAFEAPKKYNGVKYPIINDWDANIIELYRFIYLDSEEDARINLEKYR
mgnify:CR=1 FL=1